MQLDLIEGTLYIKLDNDTVKYKFIPNSEFNDIVKNTILERKSKLMNVSLDKIQSYLSHTYKDMF